MDTFSKTALYEAWTDLPPLVAQAVALANNLGFISCCMPEQGELLQVLARGRAGGVIGETGTGCGAGLAWMASAVGPETRLVSVEIDAMRAAACQERFAALPNVTVLHGDWRVIAEYGPLDLPLSVAREHMPTDGGPRVQGASVATLRSRSTDRRDHDRAI